MEQNSVKNEDPNDKQINLNPTENDNVNTEAINEEQTKPTPRSDEESDSDSEHIDIDIDIGEDAPPVDHPLLDIDKDYDEDEEIDFSDESEHPSDEPIDIVDPPSPKPTDQTIKQEQTTEEKPETSSLPPPPKEISEKLTRAQNEFLEILKTLSATEMHTYFSWIDTTLKPHNVSIFGEPKRGPGRRKGVKKEKLPPVTEEPVVSERRPPNRQPKAPKELPKRRVPSLPTTTRQLLCSPDSRPVHVNMRDVVNFKSFQSLLTPEEKDKLLRYVPPIDKQSLSTIEDMFNSNAFHSHLLYFQEMLEAGEFDKNNDDYKQYLIGKKKREQPVEEWKVKYYEEYWGQKKKPNEEETEPLPLYSFTEEAKLTNPTEEGSNTTVAIATITEEQAKVDSLRSIEDILADFGTEEVTEEMFEEPLEMLDDDFDDYSEEEEAPKKKRKYKRRQSSNHSDEEEKPVKQKRNSDKKRKKSSDGANSFRRCAHTILKREGRPLSAAEIVKIGIKEGMISTSGKTPQNTLASVLYCEMKKDPRCVFVKVAPMTFGLRTWGNNENTETVEKASTKNKRRKKKQVEEESEESEEEEEMSESEEEEEQPIIINLSGVPVEK